ncbi:MAG: hypothetical protein BMS9Abin29_0553 [Gemmatimonadota bacterium]|nr:MAG: hypothetical protein BMS9Abin29_0553 [Gemmatimonadota bacterium]
MAIPRYTDRPSRARVGKRSPALGHAALSVVLLGAVVGCSGPSGVEADTLDRDTFIAIYVDLRIAAMDNLEQEIHPTERDSILEAYGLTTDDLVAFADSHGRDIRYMTELWAEVEDLINQELEAERERDAADQDSVGGGP